MPPPSKSAPTGPKPEHKILFQKFFRSIGPRTYAVQMKEASNGNHYLVLIEGKREGDTPDAVRKTKLFVFSEDFPLFFRMLHETAQWIRANPVPEEVKRKRQRYWEKHGKGGDDMEDSGTPIRPSANNYSRAAGANRASQPAAKPTQKRPPARGRGR